MALTNKEKMRRRRARLNANPAEKEKALKRDQLRKKNSRKQKLNMMTRKEIALFHAKETERVKAFYRKKKELHQVLLAQGRPPTTHNRDDVEEPGPSIPFRTRQSLGKAVKMKAMYNFPDSPRKQEHIVRYVARKCGVELSPQSGSQHKGEKGISKVDQNTIIAFYENDEISWQAPGRKDRIIYQEKHEITGEKTKIEIQARYMLMSLHEAYKIFQDSYPDVSIGLTEFTVFRPKHCKLFDKIPRAVCVCCYHENIRLLLVSLQAHTNLAIDFRPFVEQVVCNSEAKDCMSRMCSVCINKIHAYTPAVSCEDLPIKYFQWHKQEDGMEKVEVLSTVKEAFLELNTQLKPFLIHTYIKCTQASKFASLKSTVNGKEILLQVDFSENASLIHQNEIQSVHWSHHQATLFTGHSWIDQNQSESCVIVSEDMEHTQFQVYTYLVEMINYYKTKYTYIKTVNIFSDGAASQFKQRYLFAALCLLEKQFQINIMWHFFATSHGKGVVDGVGGTVKRSVWRCVKSNQYFVVTPEDFARVAQEQNPVIKVMYVSAQGVQEKRDMLCKHWANAKPVPNCQSVHYVHPQGDKYVVISETSTGSIMKKVEINEDIDDNEYKSVDKVVECELNSTSQIFVDVANLKMGSDWVVVKYDGQLFPGIVLQIHNEDIQVSVMHLAKTGTYYKWPNPPDQIHYEPKNIVRKISPPYVAGRRGQFKFDSII